MPFSLSPTRFVIAVHYNDLRRAQRLLPGERLALIGVGRKAIDGVQPLVNGSLVGKKTEHPGTVDE